MNIIIIVSDGLRTLNLRCYGYSKNTTPTIDNLAKSGVLFKDAYACTNHTDPSFTTLLTGKYPLSHGIIHHGSTSHGVTKEEIGVFHKTGTTLLSENLKSYGYYTMAFDWLGRWHKRGYDFYGETEGFSFALGVEKSLDHLPLRINRWFERKLHRAGFALPARSGKCYTDLAIKFIRRRRGGGFFMLLHNWDTHTPFSTLPSAYVHKFYDGTTGEKVEEMHKRIENTKWREIVRNYHLQGIKYVDEIPALYDGAVNFFDHSVERLLECLSKCGILNDTLIVLTGDHGDNVLRNNSFVGHFGLYDSVIHVPLILWGPGIPKNKMVEGFVQHVDIVPTLLELLNIKPDDSVLDGQSLLPIMDGRKKSLRSSILAQDAAARIRFAIRTSDYKYIYSPTANESIVDFDTIGCRYPVELYDLKKDPGEKKNIVDEQPVIAEELRKQLLERIEELENKRDKLIRKNEGRKLRNKIAHLREMGKV